jgi:MscS family membrane protein
VKSRFFFVFALSQLLVLPASGQEPAAGAPPPVPAELSSARATMRTFLEAFDPRHRRPGVDPLATAASCLDLSEIPASVRAVQGPELAIDLKDVLDRTALIDFSQIPDEPSGAPYRIRVHEAETGNPGTVTLAPVDDGRWLFTGETVRTAPLMLERVRDKEVVEGAVTEGPKTVARWLREQVPESLRGGGLLLEPWQWLALVVLIFLGVVLDKTVTTLLRIPFERVLARRLDTVATEDLRKALRPAGLLAAALLWWPGVTWLALPVDALSVLVLAARLVAMGSVVWAAYRLVDVVSRVLEARARRTQSKFDDLLVPLVRKSSKVFIVVFGVIFIADNLDLPIASLLAGVGIGGLALALAAQDLVKNFLGSFMVIFDKPFNVGDWVTIGDVEGTVAEVGFRSTRVRTFYNSLVTVPNATLISAAIDNYGARQYRRWSTRLGIAYDTPPEKVEAFCEGIRELVRGHPHTRKDYFEVHFNEFGAAALEVMVYVFFVTPDWSSELAARHRLGLDFLRLADELGVEFAFPTQTLYLRRG